MLKEWLHRALKQAGISQAALSRSLTERLGRSIDRAAVNKMLTGQRAIFADELLAASEITGLPPPFAVEGPRIKVVGHVGAGAEVFPFDDYAQGDGLEELEPFPTDAVAVMVKGDSMYPRYFEGERIIYVQDGGSPADYIGQECIVKLEDGRMLLKIMRKGSRKGLFTLESWNAAPIEDQKIEWAAPVLWRGRK